MLHYHIRILGELYEADTGIGDARNAVIGSGPNGHSHRADDRHLANLPRLQPAALDGGETLMSKGQRHVGHIFDVRGHMRVSLAVHRHGKFAQNLEVVATG